MANGANVLPNHISIRHGLERSEVFLLITDRFDYLRSTIATLLI
jgi:hypothetical protein